MGIKCLLLYIVYTGLLYFPSVLYAKDMDELINNPFKRPDFLMENSGGVPVITEGGAGFVLDLRAILAAGKLSIVNIGGKFYKIGDVVDGYQIVEIHEGSAVFMKNGKRVIAVVHDNKSVE